MSVAELPALLRRAVPVLAVALACAGVAAPSATAEPGPACASATSATALPPAVPVLDWSENLGYDGQGNLWVSRLYRNEVQRYDDAGRLTATVPVEFPGAVRLGPDGLMYVVYGDAPTSVVRPGGVVRFDPAADAPRPEIFASGFTMPNGAAFDADGTLYVAAATGVIRIGRDGVVDTGWSERARLNANGIAVHDGTVYLTSNGGPLGRVLRFPVTEPDRRTVLTDLTSALPGVPDFADDLLVDDAGTVYVTALSGQLVRIDPNGQSCRILSAEPMTSLVALPGRPGELLAGTERGAVLRIQLAP
ncbi:SMP-30/gluconolactonase/LRE family protein [Nocardia amikacinitolerans]|uniref:SMP-30/gluconolactonase/LRE family protein n=1 Tax=Nocardia amikacinitolerans TaxID=756689 RepID=UPI0036BF8D30